MFRFLTAIVFTFVLIAASAGSTELKYAKNFTIEEYESHKVITIRNTWVGAGDLSKTYSLVPRGADLPRSLPKNTMVIRTPVERLVIMATVFLGPIQDLKLHDSLVGIAYLNFANDLVAHERVKKGLTKEIQSGSGMDVESMLLMRPDLILTSTTGNATFDVHPQMLRAGLPVVVTAGYMEEHPLARTEWIKFVAAFFEKQEEATRIFDGIEGRYLELTERVRTVSRKPTALVSAPYGGVWHVPGGESYMAAALRDAGADYLWADGKTRGGVPIDMEVIFAKGANADVWINPSHYNSVKALLAADERFAGLAPVKNGSVYNNTVRVNEHGGNDIYERGVSHPEEVLADLIKIFHPELMPDHEFVFYEKLQ